MFYNGNNLLVILSKNAVILFCIFILQIKIGEGAPSSTGIAQWQLSNNEHYQKNKPESKENDIGVSTASIYSHKQRSNGATHEFGYGAIDTTRDLLSTGNVDKYSAGIYRGASADINEDKKHYKDVRVGNIGLELSNSAKMLRLSTVTADIRPRNSKVGFSTGLTLDSGVSLADKGYEMKLLGFGGKIAKNEVQICVVVCWGVTWG